MRWQEVLLLLLLLLSSSLVAIAPLILSSMRLFFLFCAGHGDLGFPFFICFDCYMCLVKMCFCCRNFETLGRSAWILQIFACYLLFSYGVRLILISLLSSSTLVLMDVAVLSLSKIISWISPGMRCISGMWCSIALLIIIMISWIFFTRACVFSNSL